MKHWQLFTKYKIYHIVLWCLFFAGWFLFRADDFPNNNVAIKITLVKVLVLASLVYLTNYFLIPYLLYAKRYWLFAVIVTAAVVTFGIVKIYVITLLLQPYYKVPLEVFYNFKSRFYDNIIPLFLLVSTGAAVKLVLDYIVSQARLAAISREKAETELQYLKSQINPHFVFNTLNAIYFQIDKSNQGARETLIQFSDLLRYQLYECNAGAIPVEKEMAYLKSYIQLQQKRKDENYKVEFHCSPSVKSFQIVPLLLVPFVENAFKHISHFGDRPNTIQIMADKKDNTFNFRVVNSMENGQRVNELNAGGIGLKNVRRRLDLLYNGKHSLEICQQQEFFRIDLAITL